MIFFRRNRLLAALVLLFIPFSGLHAQEQALPLAEKLAGLLGWTPADAIDALGAPQNIFAYRAEVEDEDNVVFYYPDHTYLFWFRDRVWQTRVDQRWEGDIDGVKMGMTLSEIEAIWQLSPINYDDEGLTWTIPDRGYPVRIRLFFDEEGRLQDAYIFRSDW